MNRVLSCHLRFTCFERLTLKCWEVSASLDGSEHSLTFSSRSVPRAWATRRAPDSGSAPPRDLPPDFCPGSLCRALPPLLLCWGKGGGEGHRGPWQGEDADRRLVRLGSALVAWLWGDLGHSLGLSSSSAHWGAEMPASQSWEKQRQYFLWTWPMYKREFKTFHYN